MGWEEKLLLINIDQFWGKFTAAERPSQDGTSGVLSSELRAEGNGRVRNGGARFLLWGEPGHRRVGGGVVRFFRRGPVEVLSFRR
jgi:hypothetical protein